MSNMIASRVKLENSPDIAPKTASSGRILSIDALRGFDMFWIIGGDNIFRGVVMLFCNPVPEAIDRQLHHPAWGPSVTCWDLIMPLFLFIAGVSMPFSLGKRAEQGEGYGKLYGRILKRVLLLIVIGMICHDGEAELLRYFDFQHVRIAGNTLQFIAWAYLISSVALLHLPKRGQLALIFGFLLGYTLLMLYVPIPGYGAPGLTAQTNLARYIDGLVLGRLNGFPLAPTVLSGMSLSATMLLGAMAGHVLRLSENPWRKVRYLALAGLGCLILGWAWSYWFLMVKWIWSSSYALWMAGWSFLLLAVFSAVIDIWGFRAWAFPFVVIGSNAILAYALMQVYGDTMGLRLVSGIASHAGVAGDLVRALGVFGVLWIVLWYLHRKRTFLRV
jgi:predicted acyltransferase